MSLFYVCTLYCTGPILHNSFVAETHTSTHDPLPTFVTHCPCLSHVKRTHTHPLSLLFHTHKPTYSLSSPNQTHSDTTYHTPRPPPRNTHSILHCPSSLPRFIPQSHYTHPSPQQFTGLFPFVTHTVKLSLTTPSPSLHCPSPPPVTVTLPDSSPQPLRIPSPPPPAALCSPQLGCTRT